MQKTLINRALADIRVAELLVKSSDEYDMDVAAYHLQQAVEKILKQYLELRGIQYSKSHNIELLSEQCDDKNITAILGGKEFMLTSWEAGSRYAGNFKVAQNQLINSLELSQNLYSYVVENLYYK